MGTGTRVRVLHHVTVPKRPQTGSDGGIPLVGGVVYSDAVVPEEKGLVVQMLEGNRKVERYRRLGSIGLIAASILLVHACALSTEITVQRLILTPQDLILSTGIEEAVNGGDYLTAIQLASRIDPSPADRDFVALARAEMACGRFEEARNRFLRVLEGEKRSLERSRILWDLSQLAYLANDYEESLDRAVEARGEGLDVQQWHLNLLLSLEGVSVYRHSGERRVLVPMKADDPDIPRVQIRFAQGEPVDAVIDSGAVMTIVSASLASSAGIQSLGEFRGTFFGLIGEPIEVTFGLIRVLQIGGLHVHDVPVAIMPDRKLNFMIAGDRTFRIDMLLGTAFLKEFRLEFDSRAERIEMSWVGSENRVPAANQNLFFIDLRPYVHTAINGRGWYTFLLDTGSEITFLNGSKLRITDVTGLPRPHGATLQGLGGAQRRGARLSDVAIGVDAWSGIFKDIPLYDDERSAAVGLIGQNLLENFRVTIDFGTMRVDLAPR